MNGRDPHTPLRNGEGSDEDDNDTLLNAFQMIRVVNLKVRQDRWDMFRDTLKIRVKCRAFVDVKVQRFDAVDGSRVWNEMDDVLLLEWDATNNAKYDRHIQPPKIKRLSPGEIGCAMSHVQLWRLAADQLQKPTDCVLILEDDAVFYPSKTLDQHPQQLSHARQHQGSAHDCTKTFQKCFAQAWKELPRDWDIWYLGFSDRGERISVEIVEGNDNDNKRNPSYSVDLQWFRPTYGFHTHAYAITKQAAERLLTHLPVVGPLDVWLADHQWFDLRVYSCVVKNEGYHGTGAYLVTQDRVAVKSSIPQSGRTKKPSSKSCSSDKVSPGSDKKGVYVPPHRRR
jgi:GR25 family glycosyltransferase involved in LPS biosynthesis